MSLALALLALAACQPESLTDERVDPRPDEPADTDAADTEPADDSARPDACNNDAIVDAGEVCDDGNDNDLDGCTAACVATPGLKAWWPLDDAEVLGDHVSGYALTWTPGPTPGTSGPTGAWGRDGALSFYPGSTAQASLDQRPVPSSGGTFAAWVRGRVGPSGVTSATIASQDDTLWLGVDAADHFSLVAGPCAATSDVVLGAEAWLHVSARWSRSADEVSCALTVTRPGIAPATTTAVAPTPDVAPPPGPNTFALGRATAGDPRGWRGWLDQAVLFDIPLDEHALAELIRAQEGAWYRPVAAAP